MLKHKSNAVEAASGASGGFGGFGGVGGPSSKSTPSSSEVISKSVVGMAKGVKESVSEAVVAVKSNDCSCQPVKPSEGVLRA